MSAVFKSQPLEILTTITIDASIDAVWNIFSDFKNYKNWNPFLTEVSGVVEVGNTIKINANGMKFQPKVLVYDKCKELRWKGKLLFNGLFDGEHYFVFTENTDGTTTLEHGERFTGVLIPLFKNKLETETKAGFVEMNAALKRQVEHASITCP